MAIEKLTPTKCKSAKGTDSWLGDGDGLYLRVRTDSKTWVLRYEHDGKRSKVNLGRFPDMSPTLAREKAQELRTGLVNGQLPGKKRSPAVPTTLQQLFDLWLATLSRKTTTAEASTFKLHVAPTLGHRPPGDIRRTDIVQVLDAARDNGLTRTCGIILRDLRAMYQYAALRDWVPGDPTAGLKQGIWQGKGETGTRVLADEELASLEARMKASGLEPVWRACAWLLLATGNRQGETLMSKQSYVTGNTWLLPGAITKNGLDHPVHLSPFALRQLAIIIKAAENKAWLFPHGTSPDKPVYEKSLTTLLSNRQLQPTHAKWDTMSPAVRQSLLKIDTKPETLPTLDTWSPHDLRRTAATRMRRLRVKPDVVDACLNHQESDELKRTYQIYEPTDEMREAWQLLGDYLDTIHNE